MTDDPLYTPEEVSEILGGIPVKTLARWRCIKEGPRYAPMGKHVRYRRSDVLTWINSRVKGSDPAQQTDNRPIA